MIQEPIIVEALNAVTNNWSSWCEECKQHINSHDRPAFGHLRTCSEYGHASSLQELGMYWKTRICPRK